MPPVRNTVGKVFVIVTTKMIKNYKKSLKTKNETRASLRFDRKLGKNGDAKIQQTILTVGKT